MKLKTVFLGTTLVIFACAALSFSAQKKNGSAAGAILAQDKGKLNIQLDGQTVGHEEFEITPSGGGWTAKGTTEIKPPGGATTKITGNLTLESDGAPISYNWTSQADKTDGAHILFANAVAKITLEMDGGRPCTSQEIKDPDRKYPCFFEQDLSFNTPLIAVLDNNLYHQYALLARLYDWSKRGQQTFPVLIPQELTPGSVTAESTGSTKVDGKSYEALKVATADLEILLLLDSNHRLMRLEVPAAKVSVIRE